MYKAEPTKGCRARKDPQDKTTLIILPEQLGAGLVIRPDWLHSSDHRRVGIAQIYEVSPPVIHHVLAPTCQRPPQHLTSCLRNECLGIVSLLPAQGLAPEDRSGELLLAV